MRPSQWGAMHVCVCVRKLLVTRSVKNFPKVQMFIKWYQHAGGQAYHIQPGPTKLECDRGSIKGRFDVHYGTAS